MAAIRIIVADDHPVVRGGVRSVLEGHDDIRVVAEAGSPDELVALLEQAPACDVLLTDLNMPGVNVADGMALLRLLGHRWPQLPVLVLTLMDKPGLLQLALSAGARGIVLKSDPLPDLPAAVRRVQAGEIHLSACLREKWQAADMAAAAVPRTPLSPRENEVLRLFVCGMSVSEIARHLHRSVKTVSRQKMSAMAKLRLSRDIELYAYARERGPAS